MGGRSNREHVDRYQNANHLYYRGKGRDGGQGRNEEEMIADTRGDARRKVVVNRLNWGGKRRKDLTAQIGKLLAKEGYFDEGAHVELLRAEKKERNPP